MSSISMSGNEVSPGKKPQSTSPLKSRYLVGCGVVAGPLYALVALVQALVRPGFDIFHDDVSLLSNGALGWIQIANFILTGILVIMFAVGLRTALSGGRGRIWVPVLMTIYGIGLIGAGVLVADPMNGFPIGSSQPAGMTMNGMMHAVSGGLGFIGFISCCFVIAGRFREIGKRGGSIFSLVTGVSFLAAFVGIASGTSSATAVVAFWCALILSWVWIASLAVTVLHMPKART